MSNDPKLLGQHETDSIGLHNLLEIRKALQAATTVIAHPLNGVAHTVSGLTAGHFLKALSATTFGFAAHGLTYTDVGALAAGGTAVDSDKLDGQHGSYYLPSASAYTDEKAQDAVGAMIGPSLQYVDATPLLDTIQDLRTTAGPTFDHLHISSYAEPITTSLGGAWNFGWGKGDGTWPPPVGAKNPYTFNHHEGLAFSAHSAYGGIRFYNQAYPDMTLSALVMSVINDRVGIGTTAPAELLNVSGGNLLVTSPYPGTGNTPATRSILMDTINSAPGHVAQTGMSAIFTRLADSDYSSALVFYNTADNTQTERMRIISSGNVGIGTSAPAYRLGINKAVVGDFVGIGIQNNEYGAATYLSSNSISLAFCRSDAHIEGQITSSNTVDGDLNNGYMAFSTRTSSAITEKMRITSTGNVGIGTTTPGYLLEVNGPVGRRIQSLGGNVVPVEEGAFIYDYAGTTPVGGMYFQNSLNDSSNVWLGLKTMVSGVLDYRLFINNTGNVGIGTTVPDGKLTIATAAGLDTASAQIETWAANGNWPCGISAIYNAGFVDNFVNFNGRVAGTFAATTITNPSNNYAGWLRFASYTGDFTFASKTGATGAPTTVMTLAGNGQVNMGTFTHGSKSVAIGTSATAILALAIAVWRGAYVRIHIGGGDWPNHGATQKYVEAFLLNQGGNGMGEPGTIVVDRLGGVGAMTITLGIASNIITVYAALDNTAGASFPITYEVMGQQTSIT